MRWVRAGRFARQRHEHYGLPGVRTGWLATRDARLRETVLTLKDYTTICASAPSERWWRSRFATARS